MEIEIWSDIMCPFCYIGKRRMERALKETGTDAKIIWKSFQLNPEMKTEPGKSINEYLAEIKGWPVHRAKELNGQVTEMAKQEGLTYDFDRAVVANSFDAHRLIQLAKTHDLGDAAEERLFRAYFTDGKNIADHATLVSIGDEIGLKKSEVEEMLQGTDYADAVKKDIAEAAEVGLRGVPFFVIDRKYGISGAQPAEVFRDTLQRAKKV